MSGPAIHLCFKCGGPAHHGFGGKPTNRPEIWACAAHEGEVRAVEDQAASDQAAKAQAAQEASIADLLRQGTPPQGKML